ncbi:MAG: FHA domain-containing protein [Flavobacteriales bacterium]
MPKNTHIRIGRSKSNHVVLDHEQIASEHLELFADTEGNVFITDLGSNQGTKVNGEVLKGFTQLKDSDEVVLGGKVKFNWKKYRTLERDVPKEPVKKPSIEIHAEPKKPKKRTDSKANLEVESRSLYLIYGIVALLILLIYLIN